MSEQKTKWPTWHFYRQWPVQVIALFWAGVAGTTPHEWPVLWAIGGYTFGIVMMTWGWFAEGRHKEIGNE